MSWYVEKSVGNHKVDVSVWITIGWTNKYGAQVACPLKSCDSYYTSEHRITEGSAVTTVMSSLNTHWKRKHE